MIVRELVTKLGFVVDKKGLESYEQRIAALKKVNSDLQNSKFFFKDTSFINDSIKRNVASINLLQRKVNQFRVDQTYFKNLKTNIVNFTSSIQVAIKKVSKLGLVAGGVFAGISAMTISTARSTRDLGKLSQQVGLSTDLLHELSLASQQAGLKQGELGKSLVKFGNYVGGAKNQNIKFYKAMDKLGVSYKDANGNVKESGYLYAEVASKILAVTDSSSQLFLAQRILSTTNMDLVRFMAQSSDSFTKQRAEVRKLAHILDDEAVESSKKFIKEWEELGLVLGGIKNKIAIEFMPVLSKLIKGFTDWYGKNKKLVDSKLENFIKKLGKALQFVGDAFGYVKSKLDTLTSIFGGFGNSLQLAGVFALITSKKFQTFFGVVIRLAPALLNLRRVFILLSASLISISKLLGGFGLALFITELYHWYQGNDSVIGRVLKSWFGFDKSLKDIINSVCSFFKNQFTNLFDWFSNWVNWFDGVIDKTANKVFGIFGKEKVVKISGDKQQKIRSNLENYEPINKEQFSNYTNPALNSSKAVQDYFTNNYNANSTKNINNASIVNNIRENITINVPAGTTEAQTRTIKDTVSKEIEQQFNFQFLKGINSLPTR